jgi:hypothetical protein
VTFHIFEGDKHVHHTNPGQANPSAKVGLENPTEIRHNMGKELCSSSLLLTWFIKVRLPIVIESTKSTDFRKLLETSPHVTLYAISHFSGGTQTQRRQA